MCIDRRKRYAHTIISSAHTHTHPICEQHIRVKLFIITIMILERRRGVRGPKNRHYYTSPPSVNGQKMRAASAKLSNDDLFPAGYADGLCTRTHTHTQGRRMAGGDLPGLRAWHIGERAVRYALKGLLDCIVYGNYVPDFGQRLTTRRVPRTHTHTDSE